MRPLHWATLDKRRQVLVHTREIMVGRMSTVTVAPLRTTVHGIATEVLVRVSNGLGQASAVQCDQIMSIPCSRLHEQCSWLLVQEIGLHEAIQASFDLV